MLRHISLLAIVGVACGAPPVRVPHDYAGARLTTSAGDGVRVLLSAPVGVRRSWSSRKEPFGRVLVAGDARQFDRLWRELETRAPRPPVDFRRRIVVAEIRSDDGCVDEVVGLDIDRQGVARLSVANLTNVCITPLVTVAHVISLPRARLPVGGFYFQAKDAGEPIQVVVRGAGVGHGAEVALADRRMVRPTGEALGRVPVPAPGDIEVGELSSGERVFAIHHLDGSVSVLPTTTAHPNPAYHGLEQAIHWNARLRRFVAVDGGYLRRAWDERGTSIFGVVTAHLPAFGVERRGDMLAVYPPGRQTRGQPTVVAYHPAPENAALGPVVVAYRPDEAISLSAALEREGETVVIDTSLVQYADLDPALCSREAELWRSGCPPGSPAPAGLRLPSRRESMYYLGGPFAARIRHGRVSNLVYLGGGGGGSTLQESFPSFREEWRMKFSAALTGAGNAGGHLFVGGTFNVGVGRHVPASDDRMGSVRKYTVGDTFGFDLRLRVFPGWADGEPATLASFAVAPRLLSDLDGSWRIPSAIGLVLPEVGWMKNTAGDDGLFLGWSLMLQRRVFGTDIYGGPTLLISDFDELLSMPLWTFELGIRAL